MNKNWKKTFLFERESKIYSFSKNPLTRKSLSKHFYMPWSSKDNEQLMYALKEEILSVGSTCVPLVDFDLQPFTMTSAEYESVGTQISEQKETHLILTNHQSIHVCSVKKIIKSNDFITNESTVLPAFKEMSARCEVWLEVDDIYILDVNHIGDTEDLLEQLDQFIHKVQTHNIFQIFKTIKFSEKEFVQHHQIQNRWVDCNRSLTYDYYIRSCELKDNIYQESWDLLSRRTHHDLIISDLNRHKGVFFRDEKKWKFLAESFLSYKNALITELNCVYTRPLVNAIVEYPVLRQAWSDIQGGVINPKINTMIKSMIEGDMTEMTSLLDFLFYIKNAKSFLFTLKNKFTKKIHKEEFLTIENFLNRQESLIESLSFRGLNNKIILIIEIDKWIMETHPKLEDSSKDFVKDCNLKLSHLLSIMASASYADNLFFKLIEEKGSRGIVEKTFEDEVKDLLSIEVKKAA